MTLHTDNHEVFEYMKRLRHKTVMAAVIVEAGFMSNKVDFLVSLSFQLETYGRLIYIVLFRHRF